jgi:hypothetical protein
MLVCHFSLYVCDVLSSFFVREAHRTLRYANTRTIAQHLDAHLMPLSQEYMLHRRMVDVCVYDVLCISACVITVADICRAGRASDAQKNIGLP